jgi:hypothetical protein
MEWTVIFYSQRLVTELGSLKHPPFNGMSDSIEYPKDFFAHVAFGVHNYVDHVNIGLQVLNPKK